MSTDTIQHLEAKVFRNGNLVGNPVVNVAHVEPPQREIEWCPRQGPWFVAVRVSPEGTE